MNKGNYIKNRNACNQHRINNYNNNYTNKRRVYTDAEKLDDIIAVISGDKPLSPLSIIGIVDKNLCNIARWLKEYRELKAKADNPTTVIVKHSKPTSVEKESVEAKSTKIHNINRNKYDRFVPCTCGFNKRHKSMKNGLVTYECQLCGRSAHGATVYLARKNWNAIMSDADVYPESNEM